MSGVDKVTDPNGARRGGQSLRMSHLLRASLANVSDRPPPHDVVLNHFSHRHPLLRLHLRESEGINCTFCNIISGWAYACEKHCDYYLHEVCSNFPREIHHDFHPGYDHTLNLRPFQLANNNEQFHCAACGHADSVHSLFQSYYGWESCNFNLHVECASIPIALSLNVKYQLHLFLSFPFKHENAEIKCYICSKKVVTKLKMECYTIV